MTDRHADGREATRRTSRRPAAEAPDAEPTPTRAQPTPAVSSVRAGRRAGPEPAPPAVSRGMAALAAFRSYAWDHLDAARTDHLPRSVPSPVVLAALAIAVVLVYGGPPLLDFIGANLPIVRFIVAITAILLMTVPTAFVIIYLELKVIARMNLRVGPNRIGPIGAAMSVIHGLKVLSKEDFPPTGADVGVFTLAPIVTFLASVMTLLVIPFAPALVGQDLNIGLLYFFALGGLSVVGSADGRLVELQQVLAARRPPLGGPDGQLRDPADALGRGRDHPRRHDEPEPHRRSRSRARSSTGSSSSSRSPR